MPDGKLSFRYRRRRPHKHAWKPKSQLHFFKIDATPAASRELRASKNRYAFCFWSPVGPARAAILSRPVPSAQGFLALTESPKIFWSPILGFPETLEKGASRLNLHFVGLPRSQKQGRLCRQTNPLCATDSPVDCRHFDVFHVTIEFPRIMGTEI